MTSPRAFAALLAAVLLAGCGGSSRSTPTGPSTPAARASVSGVVRSEAGTPVAGAHVEVASGANAGRATDAGADGTYRLADLTPGSLTLRVTANGFLPFERVMSAAGDQTLDVTLPAAGAVTQGHVVDALTGSGLGSVTIAATGLNAVTGDSSGAFLLAGPDGTGEPREVRFTSGATVARTTWLRVPGPDATVTLIPTTFDLASFDQMFRLSGLRRWTYAPRLRIVDHVLSYESVGAIAMNARDEIVGPGDRQSLETDLTWALSRLTGGTFGAFADVSVDAVSEGGRVDVTHDDVITVTRVAGLTAATGYWGYSRWQLDGSTVVGGLIMLDRDFDTSGSVYTRSLRAHELGHALGYNHVTLRTSVMNSSARFEPTPFDLDAARVAFSRPPGNRTPDVDPGEVSVNARGRRVWTVGIH